MNSPAFETMRKAMVVSQLRTSAVNDPRVVAAMGDVARERFVPPERQALAYLDNAVPLAPGRAMNPPIVLGRLLTEAEVGSGDRALVIGAATGYAAEVLARLAGPVIALEEDAALLAAARAAVRSPTITLVEGALAAGAPAQAPYDLILIDGAVEQVPQAIIDQLADGGRLATALNDKGVSRLAIGRKAGGGFGLVHFADLAAVPLPGFARPREFVF